MLFNSFEFVVFWIGIALVFLTLLRGRPEAQKALLVAASLFFYAWWRFEYVFILLASMAVNFWIGQLLAKRFEANQSRSNLLAAGVVANLLAIGYFKYFGLLVGTTNTVAGTEWTVPTILLPLAISFFTFQQIAFLVDASRGQAKTGSLLDYAVFVTFFPQLIAGPIVHHGEMMPQFKALGEQRGKVATNLVIGVTIFAMGLVKKLGCADNMAKYADSLYAHVGYGGDPTMLEAWYGAIAYSLQIYFDFSGYSDMAVGIARVFGIILPINFFSPYQSTSIIDFWRRWHITLSRFLRDYLYIPLGGGRSGVIRRYGNLLITMLLGGLWHGAAWTFVVWGALHGIYLVINHGWRKLKKKLGWRQEGGFLSRVISGLFTFMLVTVAWVFFRAESFEQATTILVAMFNVNYLVITPEMEQLVGFAWQGAHVFQAADLSHIPRPDHWPMVFALLIIVWCLPNSAQLLSSYTPVLDPTMVMENSRVWYRKLALKLLVWKPDPIRAMFVLILLLIGYSKLISQLESPFLYFNF
jgi:alginate O-acetyltransferase complex protein AlgI